MAKLCIAIVHRDDAERVVASLRDAGHRFTQVPTIGGFLGEANATFFLAVEDGRVQEVVDLFEQACHAREVELPLVLSERLADWRARTVAHGGATILVANLQDVIRL